MELAIVLPTRNEVDNLGPMVETLRGLDLPGMRRSLVIVDGDSTDGTKALAEELAAHDPSITVLHQRRAGLGRAYVKGFLHALEHGADLVLQMDCDFSHPPEAIPGLLARIETADAVLGSRYAPGGRLDEAWPWWRHLLSWFANSLYVRWSLGIPLHDATGGFRLWRRETLFGLGLDRVASDGYIFQTEMAYLAWRLGFRLVEEPITFGERRAGQSKMSLRIQAEAAWRVFDIRRRHGHLGRLDRAPWGPRRRVATPPRVKPAPAPATTTARITP